MAFFVFAVCVLNLEKLLFNDEQMLSQMLSQIAYSKQPQKRPYRLIIIVKITSAYFVGLPSWLLITSVTNVGNKRKLIGN